MHVPSVRDDCGPAPLARRFWLLEAPDSLAEQSRRNPDGYGIATYEEDGFPRIDRRPGTAYADELFAREGLGEHRKLVEGDTDSERLLR
jgi:predicted glutamine amidotransferase